MDDIENKIKKIDVILKKEKEDLEKSRIQKETEKLSQDSEDEKRKKRLKQKRIPESKWEMSRWLSRYLDENEDELRELLKDMKIKEDEELKRWHKMKRFEKIAKLRQERENNDDETKIDNKNITDQ